MGMRHSGKQILTASMSGKLNRFHFRLFYFPSVDQMSGYNNHFIIIIIEWRISASEVPNEEDFVEHFT
jgi:hypothetical protein